MRALIGNTGLVGGNLLKQTRFDRLYNSKNISEVRENEFEYIICAGASGVKWKANKEPAKDFQNIKSLTANLQSIKANKFILISTVDVYQSPLDVNETSPILLEDLIPYGRHRRYLEEFVQNKFANHLIIRLPALFGHGLKKNFIFDLIHNHCLEWTHKDSIYQFYNLGNLYKDIQIAENHQLKLLNITTEPLSAQLVAKECLDFDFQHITVRKPAIYNVKSMHFPAFGGKNGYLYLKEAVLKDLKEFIQLERSKRTS
ncbi:NAD-dependent epimerase/dehydratase family protein [Mesobacillus campisalis]|uniref:NAD-dependent epimerase/dehydratase family protein n=1 Tax=Mesobacillus campisalis TaxID=1408103 RepID=UPI0030C75E02